MSEWWIEHAWKSILSARADAHQSNVVPINDLTETALDTSALTPGSYQVVVRRDGEDWRLFPARRQ
jgi:hypothetical protein